MTWAQSIANEKLSIFAEATRVAKAHWEAVGAPESSLLLAESASKVGAKLGIAGMGSRAEAEADPGWSQLVEFLSVAGLKDGSLERALALLAANDVTDLVTLRRSFTSLASELRKGPRALISNALAATRAVRGPQ